MEEVWKDIILPSLNPNPNPNPNPNFQTLTFQDFLSQPFSNSSPSPAPSPASPPPIALTLNPLPDRFNSPRHLDRFRFNPLQPQCLNNVSFDEPASFPRFPELGRKRFLESENSDDRRHKRMIKNRESAARSRARKQAYTNELELEVAHLMEENAILKRQQQLCLAAASQVPKKHSLHRAATAPF